MPGTDDVLSRQQGIIDAHGWAVMHVLPGEEEGVSTAPFSYTVGLSSHGYPELLIAGLPPLVGHELLNDLAARVYDKAQRFTHGQHINDLIDGHDAVIVNGEMADELLPSLAIARYGREHVRLQQVVWPDQHGRFPWDPAYAADPAHQPLIATR